MVCVECWIAPLLLLIVPFLKSIINWFSVRITGKPLLSDSSSDRERILREAAAASLPMGESGIDHSKINWDEPTPAAAPETKKPRSKKAD
jgi:hypothetical protein